MKTLRTVLWAALLLSVAAVASAQTTSAVPAKEALATASKAAKAAGKNVFVTFDASWCGWCKRFAKFLEDPNIKPIFDKYFVIVTLRVLESPDHKAQESPGGEAVLDSLGGAKQGIPYHAILDPSGKLLIHSKRKDEKYPDGANIGHPAAPEEIEHFMKMLSVGAPKMLQTERNAIVKYLKDQKLG